MNPSGSLALAARPITVGRMNDEPFAGEVKATDGGWLTPLAAPGVRPSANQLAGSSAKRLELVRWSEGPFPAALTGHGVTLL